MRAEWCQEDLWNRASRWSLCLHSKWAVLLMQAVWFLLDPFLLRGGQPMKILSDNLLREVGVLGSLVVMDGLGGAENIWELGNPCSLSWNGYSVLSIRWYRTDLPLKHVAQGVKFMFLHRHEGQMIRKSP